MIISVAVSHKGTKTPLSITRNSFFLLLKIMHSSLLLKVTINYVNVIIA